LPISFGNDVKLEHSVTFKVVKDVKLPNSFGNDVKLEHSSEYKVVYYEDCPIHLAMMSSLSISKVLTYVKM
jgi:hypothetical protein